jgi:hypothetical protein
MLLLMDDQGVRTFIPELVLWGLSAEKQHF